MDELRQIVFEEALALRLEERNDLQIVGRVRGGEAEIDLLAALIERHALQAESDGTILDGGEGQRVELLQLDLALGHRRVFLEHLAHALRIDAVGRNLVAELLRVVEAQHDGLVELGERRARAGGERVELALRQVDARGAERAVGDDIDRDEEDRGGKQADDGEAATGHRAQSALVRSTMTALA